METGMLNSFHNEEEQFAVLGDSQPEDSPLWSSDTRIENEVALLPNEDPEDLRRTLSDLSRHLASYSNLKPADYLVEDGLPADIFEQTPSPSKANKFTFSPESVSTCQDDTKREASALPSTPQHSGEVRGDNRLMDNDNTSSNDKIFASVDSVYYGLGSGVPDEKYIAYHNISEYDPGIEVSSSIQIISVDPDSYEFDSTSNRSYSSSSSRCSSPRNYSSDSESDMDEHENGHEEEKMSTEEIKATIHTEEQYTPRDVENLDIASSENKSPKALQMEKNFTVNTAMLKRKKLKSFSLPQSPTHVSPQLDGIDLHAMTFEDLKIDFSDMVGSDINISPGKAFNKNFDMSDVFNGSALDNIDFNNVSAELKTAEVNTSKNSSDKINSDCTSDIISMIEKNTSISKDIDPLDLFSIARMDDCDLEVGDINNFDLPTYLMADIKSESELIENFETSLATKSVDTYNVKVEPGPEGTEAALSIATSTPKIKTEHKSFINPPNSNTKESRSLKPSVVKRLNLDSAEILSSTHQIAVLSHLKNEPPDDSEDFVDVETLSDGEGVPVLAANNVDSLLEQFEASQGLDCNKRLAENIQYKVEVKLEDELTSWSVPMRPFTVISGQSKRPWLDSPEKSSGENIVKIVKLELPDSALSVHNTSTESIHLDHDYCSPVRNASRRLRTLSASTDGEVELSRSTFLSPQSSDISTVYRLMSGPHRKLGLGLGKGKNLSMCAVETSEHCDEYESSPSASESSEKTSSTPKIDDVAPTSRQNRCSDLSDSDCSMSDHSYSKVDFGNKPKLKLSGNQTNGRFDPDLSKLIKKTGYSKNWPGADLQLGKSVSETVINICDKKPVIKKETDHKSVPNIRMYKNSSERLLEISKNTTAKYRNSLLISKLKTGDAKEGIARRLANGSQKQSLLKPTVRNEIKMASLLKSNNCEKPALFTKKVQEHEPVLVSSENVSRTPLRVIEVAQPMQVTQPIQVMDAYIPKENNSQVAVVVDKKVPLKRKLNLEEYKKRRGNNTRSCESSRTCSPVGPLVDNWALSTPNSPANPELIIPKAVESMPSLSEMLQNVLGKSKQVVHESTAVPVSTVLVPIVSVSAPFIPAVSTAPISAVSTAPISAAHISVASVSAEPISVVSIPVVPMPVPVVPAVQNKTVNVSKEHKRKLFDPIAEASKKALQLKKMAVKKCEDKIVESKIPKVENEVILPIATENGKLLSMVRSSEEQVQPVLTAPRRKNSSYEEIIMVSVGTNTKPVVFVEDCKEPSAETLHSNSSDIESKSGIQFRIKLKSKIVRGNVFDFNTLDNSDVSADVVSECSLDTNKSDVTKQPDKSTDSLSATLKKVENIRDMKITSNSLLASIHDTLLKKNSTNSLNSNDKGKILDKAAGVKTCEELPESKVGKVKVSPVEVAEPTIGDHGEDKIIMHLKKDRRRPEMCSLAIQTDHANIKDDVEELAVVVENGVGGLLSPKDADQSVRRELEESSAVGSVEKMERSYRERMRSSLSASSEASAKNEDLISRWKDHRSDQSIQSTSQRKTNSLERARTSYSPQRSRSRYRSRSSSRWNKIYHRYDNRGMRHRDSHYSRRSRSSSRSRRKRYNSRDRKNNWVDPYSRPNRERISNSRERSRDNWSIRSVPSNCKRKRLSSRSSYERSYTPPRPLPHKLAKESRASPVGCRSEVREQPQRKGMESVLLQSPEVSKDAKGRKKRGRRRSTETSAVSYDSQYSRSHRSLSQSSSDSEGRCSSSSESSSSSSSSSGSSDSDSSESGSGSEPESPLVKEKQYYEKLEMTAPAHMPRAKAKPVEERRVVFVGRLEAELTKADLRLKFLKYGQVTEVTLHKKDDGTRYGFVTFAQAEQSYHVVERAASDPDLQRYDVSFGGRRAFCRQFYSDLDNLETVEEPEFYQYTVTRPVLAPGPGKSFDSLLQEMKAAVFAKKSKGPKA